jgi:hypothetical protein
MTTMKITLDAAMRARDVSPPGPIEDSTADDSTAEESTGDHTTGDHTTGDHTTGDGGPDAAARDCDGAQP